MGVWGAGNFDGDTAADQVHKITRGLVAEVISFMENPEALEPDERGGVVVPCNIELLALIAKQGWTGCHLPDVPTIDEWRQTYMDVWEETIDDLDPTEAHKRSRRRVLLTTFAELRQVSEARSGSPKASTKKTGKKTGARRRRKSS